MSQPSRSSLACSCAICRRTWWWKKTICGWSSRRPAGSPITSSRSPNASAPIEQSNSTALVDNQYVAKIYRQLEGGINPEIEIGSYLTDVARFANTPALLGSVELVEGDRSSAVGVLHAYVENQGDGWAVTTGYLDRYIDEQRVLAPTAKRPETDGAGALSALHRADRPAARRAARGSRRRKGPTISRRSRSAPAHVKRWAIRPQGTGRAGFRRLADSRDGLREADRPLIDQLVAVRATLPDHLNALLPSEHRRVEHPSSWRLPSRANSDREGRYLHHRLRRRSASRAGRQAAQGTGRTRRRRPDPLDRAFG